MRYSVHVYIKKKNTQKSLDSYGLTIIIVDFWRFVTFSILDTSATLDYAPRRAAYRVTRVIITGCDAMCYVRNAKKIVQTVIARPPGWVGSGELRVHVLIALVCAAVRPWPETRRVRSLGGFTRCRGVHRRPDDDLRKEIVSVGFGPGRVVTGHVEPGSGQVGVSASRPRPATVVGTPRNRGARGLQARTQPGTRTATGNRCNGKFQIRGYRICYFTP